MSDPTQDVIMAGMPDEASGHSSTLENSCSTIRIVNARQDMEIALEALEQEQDIMPDTSSLEEFPPLTPPPGICHKPILIRLKKTRLAQLPHLQSGREKTRLIRIEPLSNQCPLQ